MMVKERERTDLLLQVIIRFLQLEDRSPLNLKLVLHLIQLIVSCQSREEFRSLLLQTLNP